jgi:uncharacterized protein (TIGR02284 family)
MGNNVPLAELVDVLLDGIAFYEQAAERVRDPRLVEFFLRMGYFKKAIAADLVAELVRLGEPAPDTGSLRHAYAGVLAELGDATPRRYLDRLEEHEERLLAACREALDAGGPEHVQELARVYLPMVDRMHREMRRLKAGFAAPDDHDASGFEADFA